MDHSENYYAALIVTHKSKDCPKLCIDRRREAGRRSAARRLPAASQSAGKHHHSNRRRFLQSILAADGSRTRRCKADLHFARRTSQWKSRSSSFLRAMANCFWKSMTFRVVSSTKNILREKHKPLTNSTAVLNKIREFDLDEAQQGQESEDC